MQSEHSYNPDVLTCLANLSSDEIFTPPELVNKILDILPKELWSNKKATFLDPMTKSGVFLREIAKRLMKGLEKQIPDQEKRINHVFKNQIFGIAITELTALLARRSVYCSKTANGKYSVCNDFTDEQGNIHFNRIEHTWVNGKCKFCGAGEENYDRGLELETHAYEFIHTEKPEEIFNMKFDVIIGNPPYQLDTGGSGRQAKPIYHLFIDNAKKLEPRYIVMIIPARWYSGGFGLDEFRQEMLNDKRIKVLSDFENATQVFPGVDIAGGVCYFLWDKEYAGDCCIISHRNDIETKLYRPLNEFPIFIRDSQAIPILRKVLKTNEFKSGNLFTIVSPIKPFGLPTNYQPLDRGISCWFIQKIGKKYASETDVQDNYNLLDKYKILVPKAPIAGQTDFSKPIRIYHNKNAFLAKPGECCTESYIVAGAFDTEIEAINYRSYLFTKICRFLILLTMISQDVNRKNFIFVPQLSDYNNKIDDSILVKMWGITEDEWKYIDSRILSIDSENVDA